VNRVLITEECLDVERLKQALPPHACCGARVEFHGVVRDHSEGRKVTGIEYECFRPLANEEMERIIEETREKWSVHDVFMAHRIGRLAVGDVSLVLFVVSPHREEAFAASRHIIDELKKRVPIWKKEFYDDGTAEWTGRRR
jgi:molybdopterin synthase catalytic subunit